jgi:hypothetical protein
MLYPANRDCKTALFQIWILQALGDPALKRSYGHIEPQYQRPQMLGLSAIATSSRILLMLQDECFSESILCIPEIPKELIGGQCWDILINPKAMA